MYVHNQMEEVQLKAKAWKCCTLFTIIRSIQKRNNKHKQTQASNKYNATKAWQERIF